MKRMLLFLIVIIILSSSFNLYAIGRINETPENMGEIITSFHVGTSENDLKVLFDEKGRIPFGLFNGPMSFRIINNIIYILDSLNRRIVIKKIDKQDINIIKYDSDILASDFTKIDNGFVLADEKNLKVVIINKEGKTVNKFGEKGVKKGEFLQLDYIGVDTMENILVQDYGADGRISKFLKNGKFIGFKECGTSLFSDNNNDKYLIRFHRDNNEFVVYRVDDFGNLKEPLFKYKKNSRTSINLLGVDLRGNIYIKVFDAPAMFIYVIDKKGKEVKKIIAHNRPGMDFNRYFAIDKFTGNIYSIFYKNKMINISRLN